MEKSMKKPFNKIRFLKLLSKLIVAIPIILILLLSFFSVFIVLYFIITWFISKQNIWTNPVKELFAFAIAAIFEFLIGLLLYLKKLKKIIKEKYNYNQYKLYLFFSNKSMNKWYKSKLITSFNEEKFIEYSSQSKVIESFFRSIQSDQNSMIYIFGDKYVGKTSLLSLILNRAVNNKNDYKTLDGKIIYLCKAYNKTQIKNFIENYSLGKYENNYIFIDDIGEMPLISQIQLWEKIVFPIINSEIYHSKMVILISNKSNSYIKNKLSIENNDSSYSFEIALEEMSETNPCNQNIELFKKHRISEKGLIIWGTLVIQSGGSDTLDILLDDDSSSDTKLLFMCSIIASRFSKIVSVVLLKKIYTNLGFSTLSFRKTLKTLINNSILIPFPFLKNYIYIKQEVTRFFLDKFRKNGYYASILDQFDKNLQYENYAEKWLVYCEKSLLFNIDCSYLKNKLFAQAFNIGNYQFLLNELVILINVYDNSIEKFYKELGYLYEKVGERKTAINYLNKYLSVTKETNEIYQTKLLLFEIEHHFNQDTSYIKTIALSHNDFLRLQATYWLEHINIEQGIFNYNQLLEIVREYSSLIEFDENLNYYHILRRMYSDLARLYYLEGKIDHNSFNTFKTSMETSLLRENHIEYDDFYTLLTKAHYLHYDVIYQLGFFGYFKHSFDGKYGANPKLCEVIDTAIKEYKRCENNFKSYGDKAWMTISIRRNELEISGEVQYIKNIDELENLKIRFVDSDNELHIAFINCILCKAYFLQYYMNNIDSDYAETINKCKGLIYQADNYYKKFANNYGIFRDQLILSFLEFFENLQRDPLLAINSFKTKIKEMQNNNYHRETELIDFILKKRTISSDLICNFFKFYPIILQ